MDLRRHITAGRLSELVGEGGLETDRVIRTLGWRRVAEAELPTLKPETRRTSRPTPTGSTPTSRRRAAPRDVARVRRARPAGPGLPRRGLDPGRLAGLAQGDGLGPARRLQRRADARPARPARCRSTRSTSSTRPTPTPTTSRSCPTGLVTAHVVRRPAPSAAPATAAGAAAPPAPSTGAADLAAETAGAVTPSARMPWCSARWTPSPRARPRRRHRLQLVGRRRQPHQHRQAAAGQRPAPRHLDPRHLVPGRPALPLGRQPARSTSRATRSPGCRASSSGTTSRSPGASPTSARRQRLLPRAGPRQHLPARRQAGPADDAHRDDQDRRRAASRPSRSAAPCTARSCPTPSRTSAEAGRAAPPVNGRPSAGHYEVALQWTGIEAEPDRRRDLRPQHRHRTSTSSAPPPSTSRSRRRTCSTPTPPATSATRRPGRIPVRSRYMEPAPPGFWIRPGLGLVVGLAGLRAVRADAVRLQPARGLHRRGQPGRSPRAGRRSSPPSGTTASAASGSASLLEKDTKVTPAPMSQIQGDTRSQFAPTLVKALLKVDLGSDDFTKQAQDLLRGWDYTNPVGDSESGAAARLLQRGVVQPARPDLQRRAAQGPAGRRWRPVDAGGDRAADQAALGLVGRQAHARASPRASPRSCARRWSRPGSS